VKRSFLNNRADKRLLEGLAIHDHEALHALYRLYFPMISRLVMQNSGDEDDAKDLFQEALIILYEKSSEGEFELQSRLKTYIYAVCKRLWLKQLHLKQKKGFVTGEPDLQEGDLETDLQEHEEKERLFDQMETALNKLGQPCKSLLKDFYHHQLSMQEITEKYGYTNSANAKTQKYKCLQRLKKIFFEQPK
jgi:RNA polymerase sigma factor (sigma-70 family)